MPDSGFDPLIDDMARSLTRAEPPAGLRSAVRAAIGRPAGGLWRKPIVTGAAVVALVVIAAVIRRPPDLPPRTTSVARHVPRLPSEGPPERPAGARVGAPLAPEALPPSRTAVRAVAAAPLPVLEPIVIAPVSIELLGERPVPREPPLQMQLLEVPTPLRAERLEVEPIAIQ